jgi:hypothetical protein
MKKDKWVYLKSCHRKGVWILSLGIILQGGLSLPATSMEMVKSQETGNIRDKKLYLPSHKQAHNQDKKYGWKEKREDLLGFPKRQVQKTQPLTERERIRDRIIEKYRILESEEIQIMDHFVALTEKQDEIDGQMSSIENLLINDFEKMSDKKHNYFVLMLADLLDQRNAFVPELNRLSAEMGGIEFFKIHCNYKRLYKKPKREERIPPLLAITTLGVAGGIVGWFFGLIFPLLSPFTSYAGAALLPVTYGGSVAAYNYLSSPQELPSIQSSKPAGKEKLLFQLLPAEGGKENTSLLLLEDEESPLSSGSSSEEDRPQDWVKFFLNGWG